MFARAANFGARASYIGSFRSALVRAFDSCINRSGDLSMRMSNREAALNPGFFGCPFGPRFERSRPPKYEDYKMHMRLRPRTSGGVLRYLRAGSGRAQDFINSGTR